MERRLELSRKKSKSSSSDNLSTDQNSDQLPEKVAQKRTVRYKKPKVHQDEPEVPYRTGRINDAVNGMRLIPLGGLGEIGMNCFVFEYEDEILIVDCGMLFSDLDDFGVEFIVPEFSYLRDRREKVKAFVITHGHEDHIGALGFAFKAGIRAPIYCSEFASKLIYSRFEEAGLLSGLELRVFKQGDEFSFKHFKVKPQSVNHSIVDSFALFIDTPYGKVIHTGDFKIDSNPFYGSMLDASAFKRAGEEGVFLLLSDSTNVERHEHSLSENVILHKFEELFRQAQGLTLVAMFASNVGRIGQVFELAKKLDKKVVLSGRGMEQNFRLAQSAGYLTGAEAQLIGQDDLEQYRREQLIVLSTGSQAEFGSSLQRVANGEHRSIKLRQGDLVIMSSRYIPGNEKAIGRMINQLFKQNAEVLYESVQEIHVSGHATRPELKQMLQWVKPRFFIPVHGEYRHLVHHGQVGRECGIAESNVRVVGNGDVIETDGKSLEVIDQIIETRHMVDGRAGNEITRVVLKDRRQLAETGMVLVCVVRSSETNKILSGPDITAKGLVNDTLQGWMLDEALVKAKEVCQEYEECLQAGSTLFDLQETMRIELRRFFNQNLGKKPVVSVVVAEL